MKTRVWINFDLGIRGDYDRIYTWLDDHKAKECGEGLAYLHYQYQDDFLSELRAEVQSLFSQGAKPRVYIIHSVGLIKGARGEWLIGGRKSPPWSGFGAGGSNEIDQ